MGVHIALIGKTKEPVLVGYQYYGEIKTLYLLHSPNSTDFQFEDLAVEVKESMANIGFINVHLRQIDAFDMNGIIERIITIAEDEKGKQIFVNITGGTKLMSAAACTAAFIVGARAYYVMDTRKDVQDPIVELPVPTIPITKGLKDSQLMVLKTIQSLGERVSNVQLRDALGISAQSLSYHIRTLEKKGLIQTSRGWETEIKRGEFTETRLDSRMLAISLTNAGKLVVNITI